MGANRSTLSRTQETPLPPSLPPSNTRESRATIAKCCTSSELCASRSRSNACRNSKNKPEALAFPGQSAHACTGYRTQKNVRTELTQILPMANRTHLNLLPNNARTAQRLRCPHAHPSRASNQIIRTRNRTSRAGITNTSRRHKLKASSSEYTQKRHSGKDSKGWSQHNVR